MNAALLAWALALGIGAASPAVEQSGGTVRVDVPSVLTFQVTTLTQPTIVSGFRVSFNQAKLGSGLALRISVKAEGTLTVGGLTVPISNISWTTSQPSNGTGMNGVLSTVAYTPVFESRVNPSTGRVDLAWSLSMPVGPLLAGTGQVNLRWKLEAISP
jgi:hypothetical protein